MDQVGLGYCPFNDFFAFDYGATVFSTAYSTYKKIYSGESGFGLV